MKKIGLSEKEYIFLKKSKFIPENLGSNIFNSIFLEKGVFYCMISEDLADEIRDYLGEQLQMVGFDKNYNPTQEGILLESLIDKFFVS